MDAKEIKETNKVNEAEEAKPELKTEAKPETKAEEAKPEVKVEVKSEPQEKPQEVSVKKGTGKKKWIWLWLLIITLILLVAVYCCIANYYRTHFFKDTTINHVDCGNMKISEAVTQLDQQALGYKVDIYGRDENGQEVILGTIQASDIDYAFKDTISGVNAILELQNEWLWITTLFPGERSYSLVQDISFDEGLLEKALKKLDAFQSNRMIAPKDAYIGEYSEQIGGYEIVPEVRGTKFDVEAAISCVKAAVMGNSAATSVQVNLEEQGCYQEPVITADDKKLQKNVQKINQWLGTEILYDWNGSQVVVDSSVIKDWASFEEGEPKLDEEAVAAFVNEKALENDTTGKRVTFTTALGRDVSLKKLSYGWKTDRVTETETLIRFIYEGAKETREPAYLRKGVWKGQNDIGNSYIEADLSNQHLYVFEKGSIVFETDFVSGNINNPGCVTPAGIFGLTYKTTNAVLRGSDYETPVNYWMPFYGNFGMHDATWRSSFGGDIFLTNGSHGCLNLPLDAAAVIYGYVSEGSPIICYYY